MNSEKQNIIFIFIWCLFLVACTATVRTTYFHGNPPVWDNLIYQNEGLTLIREWLAGNDENIWKNLKASSNPLYAVLIAFSYLLFGINLDSAYFVSAFAGFVFLCVTYFLCLQIGASKELALGGVILWSITPNFLYQNFLQTRNDYALACFLGVAWLFFLIAAKTQEKRLAFYGGTFAGLGVLVKASAPGYMFFGPLLFLVWPSKQLFIDFRTRLRLVILYVLGAGLMSGWHYLPNLHERLNYYETWARDATVWKMAQYELQGNWTDYFFYPQNLLNVHLSWGLLVFLGIFLTCLGIRKLILRSSEKEKNKKQIFPWVTITVISAVMPLLFLTWNQSFSSAGDIPVLSLLVASFVALLSKANKSITIPKYLLPPLALAALFFSIPQMKILEKKICAKNFDVFYAEIKSFRKIYYLQNLPMIQIFSHPVYNLDSYRWAALIAGDDPAEIPDPIQGLTQILLPENPPDNALKLSRFSAVLLSESPGTGIGGEAFHTFNRLHKEINNALEALNVFVKVKKINLRDENFVAYLAVNRNLVQFFPQQETDDGWVEWGTAVNLFALESSRLTLTGLPIRPIQGFLLVGENGLSPIEFHLEKKELNNTYIYRSNMVPGSPEPRVFTIRPLPGEPVQAASAKDSRPLAFYKVHTEGENLSLKEKSEK